MGVQGKNQAVITRGLWKTFQRYGFLGMLGLLRDFVLSKCISPNVRLIRCPYYFRGKSFIQFGKGFTSGVGLRLDAFGSNSNQIIFGKNIELGDYVHIGALSSITIGDNVLMASKIYITDHDHGVYQGGGECTSSPTQIQSQKPLNISPVSIGNNVWLGENVCVLKGVHIGENSIIGASSVVTKSIPPNVIAVGAPARVVKRYDFAAKEWVNCDA